MRARFVGDPNDNYSGPEVSTHWGVTFTKGEWRPVTSNRFAANNHFEFDGDGDGQADPTVEEIKAELTERGVKFHPRTGPAKLAELLAEARGKEAGE